MVQNANKVKSYKATQNKSNAIAERFIVCVHIQVLQYYDQSFLISYKEIKRKLEMSLTLNIATVNQFSCSEHRKRRKIKVWSSCQ